MIVDKICCVTDLISAPLKLSSLHLVHQLLALFHAANDDQVSSFSECKGSFCPKYVFARLRKSENQSINIYSYGPMLRQPAGIQSALHQGERRIKEKKRKNIAIGSICSEKKKIVLKKQIYNKKKQAKRRKSYTKAERKCHSTTMY